MTARAVAAREGRGGGGALPLAAVGLVGAAAFQLTGGFAARPSAK